MEATIITITMQSREIVTASGVVRLEVFEDGVPPRFRLRSQTGPALMAQAVTVETVRPDGARQVFTMRDQDGYVVCRRDSGAARLRRKCADRAKHLSGCL